MENSIFCATIASLRKKFPYSELFWSVFFHIWTEYGKIRSISPYLVRMRENADQNNSEYGHFSRSACYRHFTRILTHFTTMFLSISPENLWFSDVIRAYINGTMTYMDLSENALKVKRNIDN